MEPRKFSNMTGADKLTGITLFLMIAIIPLIVRYIQVPIGPDQVNVITAAEISDDMFSYYKAMLILIGSGILLIGLLMYVFSDHLSSLVNWKKIVSQPFSIAVIVFVVTIIASSINSEFRHTVIHGIAERYEGVFILLAYIVIFTAAVLFIRSEFQFRFLLYGLLFSCFIISLIGAFQFFGRDFFTTELGNQLVLGDYAREGGLRLIPRFTTSYATLFNPNSVGAYCALMLPITALGVVYYKDGFKTRLMFLICFILTLITAIGCASSGGLVGIAFAAIVLIAVFSVLLVKNEDLRNTLKANKNLRKRIYTILLAFFVVASVLVVIPNPLRSRVFPMVEKLFIWEETANPHFFRDLKFAGNTVEVVTVHGNLLITKDPDDLGVAFNGERVEPSESEIFDEEDFQAVYKEFLVPYFGEFVVLDEVPGVITFFMHEIQFLFGYDELNTVTPLTLLREPIDLHDPIDFVGFEGRELIGSGRGYIWSRSLPLLWERPIFGSGPDTYALVFPQHDIIGKLQFLGNPYIIVDKPHNVLLQTGINTGIISLVAMIFIFGWYMITTFISVIGGQSVRETKWMFGLRIAILAGVCGFVVASLNTDSTVSISPVFWLVLGMGVALQRRLVPRE